jgi:uncharacterized protein (DUF427 family)
MPPVKIPGPDHPITLSAAPGPVEALFEGHLIARSEDVLMLAEANYPPVAYFPRADVEMSVFAKTEHTTHCPYKGEASYYSLERDGRVAENVAWSYEDPYPAMAAITGRLAFYPNRVSLKAEPGARAHVDEAVRHTDSGAGTSQASAWPPTVKPPAP